MTTKYFGYLVFLLLATGCGYHNPYVARADAKPIRLYRPLWVNRTNELGLESILARNLSSWLHKNKQLTVTEEEAVADYTLKGSIVGVATPELSFGSFNRANELSLQVTMSFTLTDNTTGQVQWERKNYTLSEAFAVSDSTMDSQSLKKLALAKITNKVAEEIYLQILNTLMRAPLPATTDK